MLRIPLALVLATTLACAQSGDYDPLAVDASFSAETIEFQVKDKSRQRKVPVLVYLPKSKSAAPVVLFSHGLGGARTGSSFLGKHWAARGYVAVFLQHAGSDESVWQGLPPLQIKMAMQQAANGANYKLRCEDVVVVLDELAILNAKKDHALKGRLDLKKVGMSGHSFGAQTTQAVSGERYGWRRRAIARFSDARIKAAMALSPSRSQRFEPSTSFGGVKIPWLLMTGTKDEAAIGDTTVDDRLAVYPALPPGNKYELVLKDGEHHAFTDGSIRPGQGNRIPHHHPAILGISTAFFDAHLKKDAAALTWLKGAGPRKLLVPEDRWQTK